MSKLIFIDLDGTIIGKNNLISDKTKSAISHLKDNGHTVILATGRPPCLFYNIDKTLQIDTYIAANGRLVRHKDETLYSQYIDQQLVQRFVAEMNMLNISVGFESESHYAVNKEDAFVQKFTEYFHLERPVISPKYYEKHPILQMIVFYDVSEMKKLEKVFSKYPQLDFNISCPYGIDVNIAGGMKDVGMDVLINHLGLSYKDTIAIGDGHNDISMIKKAHIGIAMKNSCEPLKNAADIVTYHVDDDGLYNAFKRLNLF